MQVSTAQGTQAGQSHINLTVCLMSSFTDFLQSYDPCQPMMPMFHGTNFKNFLDIIRSHVITTTIDAVFDKEELLYFYYGRPAYRVSGNVTGGSLKQQDPVCFILEPESITATKRIFPFDSGAFANNLYDDFLRGFNLNDFEVGSIPQSTQRLVSAFYGSNNRYFEGKPIPDVSIRPLYIEADSYFQMLKSRAVKYANETSGIAADDRRYTIEVQSQDEFDLRPERLTNADGTVVIRNKVLAVVMPRASLDDPTINEAVTKIWKAHPITYRGIIGANPTEFHGAIRERIGDFLENRGVL